MTQPWCITEKGVTLSIRATPNARSDAFNGLWYDADARPYLCIKVSAIAEDNAANGSIVALLAKHLSCRYQNIALVNGHTSRLKRLSIQGEATKIVAQLEKILG